MSDYPIFAQKQITLDAEQIQIYGNPTASAQYPTPSLNFTYNGSPILTAANSITLASVGTSPNANGAVISNGVLTLEPANATNPGVLTSVAQPIAGAKTFLATPILNTGIIGGTSGNLLQAGPDPTTFFAGGAGTPVTTGTYNVGVGPLALGSVTTGHINTAIGESALGGLLTGVNNEALGQLAGSAYVGAESNNLCLSSTGTVGDSGVIRLGRPSFHTSCYIQGVDGVTVTSGVATYTNASGQFGTTSSARGTKRNIEDISQSDVDKVLSIPTKRFKYIADKSGEQHFGAIAEDVDQIMPDAVVYSDEDKKIPKNIQYHKFVPILMKIAQDSRIELKKCRDDIESLKADLVKKV